MNKQMALFVPGVLFAVGLAVSGMTNPARVIGFLDVAGDWDPTMAFVIAGALATFAVLNSVIHRGTGPLLWGEFPGVKATGVLDTRLFIGTACFGIGWGIAGLCPGPAIASLSRLTPGILVFVVSMAVGMVVAQQVFGVDEPPS